MFRRRDFRKIELFGGGKKNTKIFKVEYLKNGKIYALKEVEARDLEKLNDYKEEAVQLSRLQAHPNILQIFGYYFYETTHKTYKLGIICEFLEQKYNLEYIYKRRANERRFWKEDQLLIMIYSLIDAFAYLQHVGVCHRDIKPTNLFLMDNYEIKVIDFGESKESLNDSNDEDDEHPTMATIRGTPQYLSPLLWEGHVIVQAKQIEHNMYKSDVFSAGLVLFQMASLREVTGFNMKTEECNGERLIKEGLRLLSKTYSKRVIDILGKMLQFEESKRPTFIELGQMILGTTQFVPRTDLSLIGQMALIQKDKANSSTNSNNNNNTNHHNSMISNSASTKSISTTTVSEKSDEEKAYLFKRYIKTHNLDFNRSKNAYWFEYGGNMIARYSIVQQSHNQQQQQQRHVSQDASSNLPLSKWKLIGKYKYTFPYHCIYIQIPNTTITDDTSSSSTTSSQVIFIIGGTDSNNTYQYINDQIIKKASMNSERSFMSVVYLPSSKTILAIGGYDYQDKTQLNSIEEYNILNDSWNISSYQPLKIPRSQSNALLFNVNTIYVFGGYNKNYGTLNTIEKINTEYKTTELLELKLLVPLRRFASLKIMGTKVLLMGGITRMCKDSDDTFIIDFEQNTCSKYGPLPRGGIIDQEPIVDDIGQVHLFFENNYGTSPNQHVVYSYLNFN